MKASKNVNKAVATAVQNSNPWEDIPIFPYFRTCTS